MARKDKYDPTAALADLLRGLGDDYKRVDMVYLGRRFGITRSGKMSLAYAVIGESVNDGRPIGPSCEVRYYEAEKGGRNFVPGMPGAIYAFPERKDKPSIVGARGVYLELWRNAEDCAEWIALDRAAELAAAQNAAKAKELKANLALERLRPFREAYRAAGHKDRALLLAWIIGEITK
jgi:hypothetical protein